MRGFILSVEGIDKCGKSTQAKLLFEWLKAQGHNVILLRKPGSIHIGALIRQVNKEDIPLSPVAKILLYAADFSVLASDVISPALSEGKIVVNDRYIHSAFAYGAALGLSIEWLKEVYKFVPPPDVVFIFDLCPRVALERIKKNRESLGFYDSGYNLDVNTRERSFLEFQERVRKQYRYLAKNNLNIYIINATKGIQKVHKEVKNIFVKIFGSM